MFSQWFGGCRGVYVILKMPSLSRCQQTSLIEFWFVDQHTSDNVCIKKCNSEDGAHWVEYMPSIRCCVLCGGIYL